MSRVTEEMLQFWMEQQKRLEPNTPPGDAPLTQAVAVCATTAPDGIILRLACHTGEKQVFVQDIVCNAFIASAIAALIRQGGKTADWLKIDGKVKTR